MKNTRNIIIGALLIVILLMAVGYSTFATQMTIEGTAEITGIWDVKITNIEVKTISEGCDAGEPQYTNTKATFYAKLQKPGDSITYAVTIQNAGTINARLSEVIFKSNDDSGSSAISYSTTTLAATLNAGEQTVIEITITYDSTITEVPDVKTKTITGTIEYVQM